MCVEVQLQGSSTGSLWQFPLLYAKRKLIYCQEFYRSNGNLSFHCQLGIPSNKSKYNL